jgi:hypothetical protein
MKYYLFIIIIISKCYSQNCNYQLATDINSVECYNSLFYKKYNLGGIEDETAYNYRNNNYNPNGVDLYSELSNLEPLAYMIESFIIMYETTKDKAYLIKQ